MYVSAETSERLSCDASLVVMRHAPDGSVLDVGRKTRTIPASLRRALIARDTRCQFPGCTARRCDGHHIRHWADGGPTSLDNLALLCRRHHRAVHEEGFAVARTGDGALVFHRPDGTRVDVAPPGPDSARLAITGVVAGANGVQQVENVRFDVGWALDVLRDAPAGLSASRPDDQGQRKPDSPLAP
jgi:hypothetical protein